MRKLLFLYAYTHTHCTQRENNNNNKCLQISNVVNSAAPPAIPPIHHSLSAINSYVAFSLSLSLISSVARSCYLAPFTTIYTREWFCTSLALCLILSLYFVRSLCVLFYLLASLSLAVCVLFSFSSNCIRFQEFCFCSVFAFPSHRSLFSSFLLLFLLIDCAHCTLSPFLYLLPFFVVVLEKVKNAREPEKKRKQNQNRKRHKKQQKKKRNTVNTFFIALRFSIVFVLLFCNVPKDKWKIVALFR